MSGWFADLIGVAPGCPDASIGLSEFRCRTSCGKLADQPQLKVRHVQVSCASSSDIVPGDSWNDQTANASSHLQLLGRVCVCQTGADNKIGSASRGFSDARPEVRISSSFFLGSL